MCNSCNSCNSCNCCGCSALARALNNLFDVANRCGCNCGCNSCGNNFSTFGGNNGCNCGCNACNNASSRSGFGSCSSQNCCSDAYYARQYALYSVSGNCCFCCCNN